MPVSTNGNDAEFPVIGIGGSYATEGAMISFIEELPSKTGMAYVYVHRACQDIESYTITPTLKKISRIAVEEVEDEVMMQPDTLYVVPQEKLLSVSNGKLSITSLHPSPTNSSIIDRFLSSLAIAHQCFAAGIILYGSDEDGRLGLKAIKEQGGITFQNSEIETNSLPEADNSCADFTLPPAKIARKLLEINKGYCGLDDGAPRTEQNMAEEEKVFDSIIALLKVATDVDFQLYKRATVMRRIQRRIVLSGKESPQDYLDFLRENNEEKKVLFNDMLISVTDFFRDAPQFEFLKDHVLRDLVHQRGPEEIRLWVAGCASGEEAYSLAILLYEIYAKEGLGKSFQIFATDISGKSIAKARRGSYSLEELRSVSPERLDAFFTMRDGCYQVKKELREKCVFAVHDFLKDPPFSRIDLVTCRNVLIYLDNSLREKALSTFHYALSEEKYLMLGKSESLTTPPGLYAKFNDNEKIFSRLAVSKGAFHDSRLSTNVVAPSAYLEKIDLNKKKKDIFQKADEILLTTYTHPAILINDSGDILQFRGDTTRWLTIIPGKASLNVLKMAKPEITLEIRTILEAVKQKKEHVLSNPIKRNLSGLINTTIIEAHTLPDTVEPCYLMVFRNIETTETTNVELNRERTTYDISNALRVEELEREIAVYRDQIRHFTEEYETANEELHTANEELLSGSEQMQSLIEELEASREHLESTNVELITLNQELLDSNLQLRNSRKYREDVFVTLREAILILDEDFTIATATDGFTRKFLADKQDIVGYSLFEISNKDWDITPLRENIVDLFSKKEHFENIEVEQGSQIGRKRTLLINGRRLERADGKAMFMIAIEDVSDQRAMEQAIYEIKKVNVALENSNMELEQFAAIASHDLQEPLRKIVTFSNIILESNMQVSENAKSYINKIAASADRMQSLIIQLLNYSKISGTEKVVEAVNLDKILSEVLNDFEVAIQQSGAEIRIDALPVVAGNTLYINQLFYNLINNALKFHQEDKIPVITITAHLLTDAEIVDHDELDKNKRYADIIISDNGIGFEQKFSSQIFKLFQRLNSTQKYPGTGIGLALCRKIAVEHGGKITVDSKEGQGTTFHVILPLHK